MAAAEARRGLDGLAHVGASARDGPRPARRQADSARGNRMADPDISVAMKSSLSPEAELPSRESPRGDW